MKETTLGEPGQGSSFSISCACVFILEVLLETRSYYVTLDGLKPVM